MEATLTTAKIAKQQAYAGYLNAKSGITKLSTMSRVAVARAAARSSVDSAQEALALAKDALSNATLTAPIDGIVIFNALGAPGLDGMTPKAAHGAAVGPQAAPFTIVQLGSLNFNAQVDEADIARVEKGMTGAVSLDAFPTESIDAKVTTVRSVAVQTTTGGIAFPVLMKLNAPGKRLLLGMSGSVDIQVTAVTDAVSVPIEALFDENGKKYVFVVAAGKVAKREVTVGAMTETRAQITSGVDVGADVAISNLSALSDGAAVRTQ
jgi:RND family efflux transporter MFP subunit